MPVSLKSGIPYALPAALTYANVERVLQEVRRQREHTLDLAALVDFDAAGLALLLALRRQQYMLHNIPTGVLQLAQVYGVEEVFLEVGLSAIDPSQHSLRTTE